MNDLTKFKKLTQLQHIRARPGIYIGNINRMEAVQWLQSGKKFTQKECVWNPGVLKLFDETISNSVDEHIRSKSVTKISVCLNSLDGSISVEDDGGIPVQIHPEYKVYVPEMIFGELMSGSNFDDSDRTTAGVNGLGIKLVNILSSKFSVETGDGKKKFFQTFTDGMTNRSSASIANKDFKGTKIEFIPDYEYFKSSIEENFDKLTKRVYDIAGCNPQLKVYLNSQLIEYKKFSDYVSYYTSEYVYEESKDFSVAIAPTQSDSFMQVSFVNGVDTMVGGSHVEYVTNQIVSKLRELIKKKHKIDVKPNIIKQQLFLIMKCTINAPAFNSQTKEYMCSEVRDFGTSYQPSDKFIKQIFESPVIENVLNWVEAEKRREELAELKKVNKQTQTSNFLKRIEKFDDATSKDRSECTLYLTEGDSASKTILAARDAKTCGIFSLRGKFLNVRSESLKVLAANNEFQSIMAIMGLKLGTKVNSIAELRFGKICLVTDSDLDGHHISGLIFNMFHEFWPELFELGVIHKLTAPVIMCQANKTRHEFKSKLDYEQWAKTSPKHTKDYYKGLGSYSTADFKRFLNDSSYLVKVTASTKEDVAALNTAFDKTKADERKAWLLEDL